MILICGGTHDSVLYFESVLANKRTETILNRYEVQIGTIFSQEVLVLHEMTTSILSAAVLSNIFDKYYIDLVIVVGRCIAVNEELKSGDVAISSKIIDGNVDLTFFKDTVVSQIPGFERDFKVQDDILNYLSQGLARREKIDFHKVTYISTDNFSDSMINTLNERHSLFGLTDDKFVIDYNSSGIALASKLKEIPYISAKVIENRLGEMHNIDTYANVLQRYIDLGKAVVSTISDIGRGDILEGDGEDE